MKQIYSYLITVLLMASFSASSQTIINTYGQVTAMSGTSLTIANATGTFTTGQAIIMQMQDSVIGANTANNSSFGNIDVIRTVGKSEVVSITAVSGTTITIASATVNTFHFGVNARVQLISYPTLGAGGNYTLSSSITATPWNGNVGGVVAFNVAGTLILNNNISVTGQGFRGGAVGANAPGDVSCDPNTYYNGAGGVSTTYYGFKGEGIYNSNNVYTVARGKLANGAGGGNVNNSGGGGGGNFTAGGQGGLGWTCTASTTGAGVGGADLSTYISSTRFFLGGGGGGAQQNNNVGSAGGNGGGIIMIKANSIQTNSGCNSGAGSVSISAKGQTSSNSGNDGAGGAGAGGSVLIQSSSYTVNSGCPIKMNTSGGNGGTVNDAGAHGGGAGGGKGVIIFSGVVGTPANINVTDTAGTGGGNDNTTGGAKAGAGSTTSSSGSSPVIYAAGSALPVHLTSFTAIAQKNKALLQWSTSIETNFAYYEIERSVNSSSSFKTIGKVTATGDNSSYKLTNDITAINGTIYYRLKMVDKDAGFQYSDTRAISVTQQENNIVRAYPNPAIATVYVYMSDITATSKLSAVIHDMQGRMVKYFSTVSAQQDKTVALSLEGISTGQYIVTVNNGGAQEHAVITKQ